MDYGCHSNLGTAVPVIATFLQRLRKVFGHCCFLGLKPIKPVASFQRGGQGRGGRLAMAHLKKPAGLTLVRVLLLSVWKEAHGCCNRRVLNYCFGSEMK